MAKTNFSTYKGLFIAESREHMENLNRSLLKLEQKPNDTEHINEMFRSAHTLKGMAATMGYENLSELAHKLENLLGNLRGSKKITKRKIDLLFECIDTLGLLVDEIVTGKEGEHNLSELYNKISRIQPDVKKAATIIPRKIPLDFTQNETQIIE